MKKIIVALVIACSTLSLYAHLESKKVVHKSSYDMPTKCGMCGKWHIPGVLVQTFREERNAA